MRLLRRALSSLGLAFSCFVMLEIMAVWCKRARSSNPILSNWLPNCFLRLPPPNAPGNKPNKPAMPPILRIWVSWVAKSSRSNWPFFILAAIFSALCASMPAAAFSTNAVTSPCPKMRPARRVGSNNSISSRASPVPNNLIGTPVIWRIERAAPPRPSPSMRVSIMPDRLMRAWNCCAIDTASCPVRLSAISNVSSGLAVLLICMSSAIRASSACPRPAVSNKMTS